MREAANSVVSVLDKSGYGTHEPDTHFQVEETHRNTPGTHSQEFYMATEEMKA
ncbi:hypothetical protein DPMN_133592 [Dreissena polymorpha]|uniref:Uncharacterized protein n=1 Tax=Dreissena polymorpha TaxID=45954 RepID=A0A9D4FYG0_DREPO|nr:hypothetical protein DPMN_133481 [Dreissena polymorpha]KAH3805294.1 hypothetical protein DPMN_133592 [Dreissena polymorpha]